MKRFQDPRVRKDGKCVVCQKTRPVVAVTHEDPFCTSKCCHEWYEINVFKKEVA